MPVELPQDPVPGQAYNKAFSSAVPGVQFTGDFGPTKYYVRLVTDQGTIPVYSRNLWIGGCPDVSDETDSAVLTQAGSEVLKSLTKYLNNLRNTGSNLGAKCNVSIRSVDATPAAMKQCTAWNSVGNIYTVPGNGFVVGQPVIAEGFKSKIGGVAPKGRYIVSDTIGTDTISLAGATPLSNIVTYGSFRPAIFVFNPVTVAVGQGFTKHNVGRPSGLSVGRRPTPRIARA